jgi:hypothetical protein
MTAMVTADSGKPVGEVAALQVFLYNLGNSRPPESIVFFIPLIKTWTNSSK